MESRESEKIYKFFVGEEEEGKRLDVFLVSKPDIASRSYAQHLIEEKKVAVNGKYLPKHYRLKKGEEVVYKILPPQEEAILPRPLPLKIIYEDNDVIVLSKPSSLVVHPAPGHLNDTLVNVLIAYDKRIADVGGKARAGIVHRLDKDTSGLMVVARNDEAYASLSRQVKLREVKRTYLALVYGVIKENEGKIDVPIGRGRKIPTRMVVEGRAKREAITYYKVVERFKNYTLLEVDLATGRTHQIRVHTSYIKHPIVGDPVYGPRKKRGIFGLTRQFLHAYKLSFTHPRTQKVMEFKENLPNDLEEVLNKVREKETSSDA